MISCPHCQYPNQRNSLYCNHCGNQLNDSPNQSSGSAFGRMPSWLLAIMAIVGALALMAAVILLIASMSTFEGVASFIFLVLGVLIFVVYPLRIHKKVKQSGGRSIVGAVVVFFAFMGAVIDQTGNWVYNKPVEWCNCHEGTSLNRNTDVTHPYAGKTTYTQNFTCYNLQGEVVNQISMLWVILIRFGEYIVLGLLLVGLQRIIVQLKDNRSSG
jgi:hypothetical protein